MGQEVENGGLNFTLLRFYGVQGCEVGFWTGMLASFFRGLFEFAVGPN